MAKKTSKKRSNAKRRCGLCGKTTKLTRTDCCGNFICDDMDSYQMFSYARNSCARNHMRFTLCGSHDMEEHDGRWQDCKDCRDSFQTEMYVWYGTNEYNFEKLENPPSFEPTHCADCGKVIHLGTEGYSTLGGKTWCEDCTHKNMSR